MFESDDNPEGMQRDLKYYGKYAGLVIGREASLSGGAHRGYVKVQVPGILEETEDGLGNRPLEVVAAPSFLPGFFFVPEVGAQVWVEFIAGDLGSPIWTGVWYPEDAPPKTYDDAAPTEDQRIIRTTSGQVIHIDDTSGSEKMVLKDGKSDGSIITMDDKGITIKRGSSTTVTITDDTITLEQGQSTVTVASDSITYKNGPSTLTLKADSVEIKGPKDTIKMDAVGTAINGTPLVFNTLLKWLASHTHIGNMGAPTPLNPAQMAQLFADISLVTKPG